MSNTNFAAKSYRTEALVLRTYKLGEADRIIVMVTPTHGQVRAVARGVRRAKSKIGARLEPFSYVDIQLVPGRSLEHISQVEMKRGYGHPLVADYPAYTSAVAVSELAEKLTDTDTDSAREQFQLALGAIAALARNAHPPQLILDSYLLRAMASAGWRASLDHCASCHETRENSSFSVALGGVVCTVHRPPGSFALDPETLTLLTALQAGDWESATAANEQARARAANIIASFVQFHVERSLKSLSLVERS